MIKKQRIDDKVIDNIDLASVHSSDIRKNKIYDGTYFVKRDSIRLALQNIINDIDASKEYSGSDLRNIIKRAYDKI